MDVSWFRLCIVRRREDFFPAVVDCVFDDTASRVRAIPRLDPSMGYDGVGEVVVYTKDRISTIEKWDG